MTTHYIKLTRDQKIAFARLISDLIEADFIVEEGEMEYFERIISKDGFNISGDMLVDAKKMDFAKAVSLLKELDTEGRKQVVEALKQLSMSDGTCVPLEAIQIFAVEQAMENDAMIYSVPASDVAIDNMKVIYIESDKENNIADQIENNSRSISNEFALAGFDFVLIPHVVSDYNRMSSEYLGKVIRYMIPSISEDKVGAICNDLRSMTTARFCRDLLDKKLEIPLIDVNPSLLIKINESDIVDQFSTDDAERMTYANFLQIELKENVLGQIRELIDRYHSMISCSIMVDSKPKTQKFLYYGFHRSLFDLIAFGKEQKEYQLVFDLTNHKASVYFESLDEDGERIPLKLNPQETALFYMIAKKSLDKDEKGLDWRDIDYIPSATKKRILEEYNEVYSYIGKGNTVRSYKDRVQTNHIRNRIKAIKCIANKAMFIPEYDKDGNRYKIRAKIDYVVIMKHQSKK